MNIGKITGYKFYRRVRNGKNEFIGILQTIDNSGEITPYEIYRRVGNEPDLFVGTLPERRKDPARITEDSIMNWARSLYSQMSEEEFRKDIYFVQVAI